MGRYSRHLKIVLLIAIILTVTTVILSVSSSLQSLKRYKENLVDFSEFVMRSFESGNRAFMMNEQFSRRTIEQFAQDISKQQIIEDIVVYSASGEIVLSVGDRKSSSYQGLLGRRSDDIDMVEMEDSFFLFKRFNPFAGMPMGRMGGHMMGEGMMHMWNNDDGYSEDYYIGILLNKSEYSSILHKSIVDVSQVIILGFLLVIIFFYSVRIIGEYERKNRQLQIVEREAEIGKFANVLAHEIKNPLSSMRGLVRFSANKTENVEIAEYLNSAVEEIDRLNKIVNDFLSYGREMNVNFSSEDIIDLLNHTLSLLKHDIEDKNIDIVMEGSTFAVFADKDKLLQAVMNILLNAVQASPENDKISILMNSKEKSVVVKNNVTEKKELDKDKLFEPFYTNKAKGSGLGMAIAKKIMMLHYSNIYVKSTQPFVVELNFSNQKSKDILK
jgi:two-component system sensor histidine kinase HydH